MLTKEIEDTNESKDSIVKMTILLKATYRFSEIPIKIITVFFHRSRKKS
jgi:hypothetical protein